MREITKFFSGREDCPWDILCDKNVVIGAGFVYGMTWFGWRSVLRRPLTSLILGSLICAPLAAFGTEILCDILPKKALGVVPVLLAGSFVYNGFIKADEIEFEMDN